MVTASLVPADAGHQGCRQGSAPAQLGILGFGEAAYTISRGLHEAGAVVLHAWKRRPWQEETLRRASDAGVSLVESAPGLEAVSDMYVSLVHPTAAVVAARSLGAAVSDRIYVDLTTRTPRSTEKIGQIVSQGHGSFVDGAIMGPLKQDGYRVSVALAGPLAEHAASILNGMGMNTHVIGKRPGLASTVKMIRSVYSKGLEAAVTEMAIAAHVHGSFTEVLESLRELLALPPFSLPFPDMVRSLLREQLDHAPRRAAEMKLVSDTITQLGIEPVMAEASQRRLARSAASVSRIGKGESYETIEGEILAALASNHRRSGLLSDPAFGRLSSPAGDERGSLKRNHGAR